VTATGTGGHPDVTEISDLTEGLLSTARAAEVRRHLDTCGPCADVLASLEEIRGLLGSVPEAVPMPDDVAQRIDAALTAEALLGPVSPGAPGSSEGGTPVDTSAGVAETLQTRGGNAGAPDSADDDSVSAGTSGGRAGAEVVGDEEPVPVRAHVSRETVSAADRPADHPGERVTERAADRPAGHPRAAGGTGPGRKPRSRGARRRMVVLGAMAGAAAVGLGSFLVSTLGSDSESTTTAQSETFSGNPVQDEVSSLLAQAATTASRSPQSFGTQGNPENDAHVKSKALPQIPMCVLRGIDRTDEALAARKGRYKGDLAYLVLLPDTRDTERVDAYVVNAACETDPSVDAEVLFRQTYPRSAE
jgi:hypothetical protein